MNLKDINFPRQLEAAGLTEQIRAALTMRMIKLWPEGKMEVPLLSLSEELRAALQKANLQRRIRIGLDDILEQLAAEKKGIDALHVQIASKPRERVSRLLLFSSDGADRFYRHIEQTLLQHHERILGCLLDIDSKELGRLITGKSAGIKAVLVEHKDAVADVLTALAHGRP